VQFDCARCEELLLDFAYGELDEVTAAAFRRHADSCARCGASLADVRVVREAFSMLPLETPSPTVDARILAAADTRLNELDDKKRALQREDSRSLLGKLFDVFRVVAVRPQYAMAMVLVLVVGIGLYVAPRMEMTEQAAPGVAPTLVGEQGPELSPLPAPPPAVAVETNSDGFADRATATPSAPEPAPAAAEEEAQERAIARGPIAAPRLEGRARGDQPEERPAQQAPLKRSLEADGQLAENRARDRAAPVVVVPAPAPSGLRGSGGGGDDEDSGARLGFAQTPREAERQRGLEVPSDAVVARSEPSRRESRSFAPAPAPQAPAARQQEQRFARPPASVAPSAPPANAPSAGALLQMQQQGQSVAGAPGASASTGTDDASAFERGMRLYRAGQYRAAIPDLQQAIARPGLTNDALATAYHAMARSLKESSNYAEAARRYEELMRRFPAFRSNAQVNFEAGECYQALGNQARADQLYRVAERSAQYGERARARRVQMDGARRSAPSFDAAEAVEASPEAPAAAH